MKNLKLVIVSVFFNRASLVEQSVASIAKQLEEGVCIILVDDGSTDNTLEKLKSFEGKQVIVLSHENRGFVACLQSAVGMFNSEYIAIHGAGDISLPHRFNKQMKVLERNPQIGLVGCYRQNKTACGRTLRVVKTRLHGEPSAQLCRENPFSHGEMMFKRTVYDEVGGYRSYFKYAQDVDLWCRMSRVCSFSVVPEVLYERLVEVQGSVSASAKKTISQRVLAQVAIMDHVAKLNGHEETFAVLESKAKKSWYMRKFCFKKVLASFTSGEVQNHQEYRAYLHQQSLSLVFMADLLKHIAKFFARLKRSLVGERLL